MTALFSFSNNIITPIIKIYVTNAILLNFLTTHEAGNETFIY